MDQAIWGENSAGWFVATDISNNTFENCSFALHWGYNAGNIITNKELDESKKANYSDEGNYFRLANNTIVGTENLRNKVVVQDSYDVDMCAVTISGNKLSYGLIGLVNIEKSSGQLQSDLLKDNTFTNYSFVVEANSDYAKGKEKVAVYKASNDSYGQWVLQEDNGLASKDFYPLIEQAVAKANATGSKELQITGLEGYEEVLYTFTWYKDAIYWEKKDAPEITPEPSVPSTPDIPKTGDETPLLGMALCALAAGAAVVILLRRRQRV